MLVNNGEKKCESVMVCCFFEDFVVCVLDCFVGLELGLVAG
jgi:hypothetical protein